MFRHTIIVMMLLVIGGDFCIIKEESAPLQSFGQGTFTEMPMQLTPHRMEPEFEPLEKVYSEGKIRSMDAFVDRLEQQIRVWAPQNIVEMNMQTLIPFPIEFENDEEETEKEEHAETAKWNAMSLKLKNLKLSAYIIGVGSQADHKNAETYKYFFVILKNAHLKFIQLSIGDKASAKIAAEAYIDDPQFETIIQEPIWKTNGKAVLVKDVPISVIPDRYWGGDYEVLSCWKLSCELGVDRYISMLKHESDHAHWFFVSALMFGDVYKPTQINYVGGYVNSPEMAEISALNFMNLLPEFKNGIWSDSSSQPGTWSCGYSGISWKAETPRNAIYASIDKIVASDKFVGPKDITTVDVSYFFAIGTRHMPCPISPEEYSLYLLHSIDYYWITVQIQDSKGGFHLISIVHRYLDNIYYDTKLEEYSGYYPVETMSSAPETNGDENDTHGNEPGITLTSTKSESEKGKSTNFMSLFYPGRALQHTKSHSEKRKSTIPNPNFYNRSKSGRDVSKIFPPQ